MSIQPKAEERTRTMSTEPEGLELEFLAAAAYLQRENILLARRQCYRWVNTNLCRATPKKPSDWMRCLLWIFNISSEHASPIQTVSEALESQA